MVDAKLADKMKANKTRLEGLVVMGDELFGLNQLKKSAEKLHVQHDQIIDHRRPVLAHHMDIDFHRDLGATFDSLN